MTRTANSKRVFGLVVSTALTGVLLSGCTTASLASLGQAGRPHAGSQQNGAIGQAEAAVLADPRNAAARAALGSAYLDAGRFASAATSYDDAMKLGDTSPRTALGLALALTGEGKLTDAAALLNEHDRDIAVADLGLALAVAGQPERGVQLMSNAIRAGENTAKMRQNLAMAYALAGRWREARLMAEQDVPGNQVSDRIQQWAELAQPQAWQQRVAALLSVPAGVADAGQPVMLALNNAPALEQFAAAPAETAELPVLAGLDTTATVVTASLVAEAPYQAPAPALPSSFQSAFKDANVQDGVEFVASPVVQASAIRAVEVEPARIAPAPVRTAPAAPARVAASEDGTHLIQLGSFTSEAAARRAWSVYATRYPDLAGHRMVLSEALVNGKHYWRVSAAGFARTSAASACGRIKSASQGCLVYAEGRPLPGAVDKGTRLAQR